MTMQNPEISAPTENERIAKLEAEIARLNEQYGRKANTRLAFRREALAEIVNPQQRIIEQHEAKRTDKGGIYENVDLEVETLFHRIGQAMRGELDDTERQILFEDCKSRIADNAKFKWCKACGEEMADCLCSIPKPRQAK